MVDFPTGHSPLGASGAERWMECPGSTQLIKLLDLSEETDDPDYRVNGTTAHWAAAECFKQGLDAWEMVGEVCPETGQPFTGDMTASVQYFVDYCRKATPPDATVFVEHRIIDPGVHPYFYGQVDYGWILDDAMGVYDYKHGEGIVVECKGNPQPRYYGYGLLRHPLARNVEHVFLAIIQPRAFHPEGPEREDTMTAHDLRLWATETLVPSMERALTDKSLLTGKHCRFCPAKLLCPALGSAFRAMATANVERIQRMPDEAVDLEYRQCEAVDFYQKALREEAFKRAMRGSQFTNAKLVAKKADRVWKPGAQERLVAEFGEDALNPAQFKSPPQIEKLGSAAKVLVKEYAFTPNTGYTMASREDKRTEVTVQPNSEVFAAALRKMEAEA